MFACAEVELIPARAVATHPRTVADGASNGRHGLRAIRLGLRPVTKIIRRPRVTHVDRARDVAHGMPIDTRHGLTLMCPRHFRSAIVCHDYPLCGCATGSIGFDDHEAPAQRFLASHVAALSRNSLY